MENKTFIIRQAKKTDIDQLTQIRLDFANLIRKIDEEEVFLQRTRTYFEKNLEQNSLISFLAVQDEKIIATVILCVYETLPTPNNQIGKTGLLLNVYTEDKYRRQGIALELMNRLIEEARNQGIGKIILDYTKDGYPLYKKLGFVELDKEMKLSL